MSQIKRFHQLLYSSTDKIKQDTFILTCCNGTPAKRPNTMNRKRDTKVSICYKIPNGERGNTMNRKRDTKVSICYKIPNGDGGFIRVCKKAFVEMSGISRFRIENVVKKFVRNNHLPKERRGGDRVGDKYIACKIEIKRFIETLKCVESHYCRSIPAARLYLPCEMNLKKLYAMYCSKVNENVKLSYFREFVNRNYNISFGTPKTDVCSICLRTEELLKTNLQEDERHRVELEYKIHKKKSKAFFTLLQTEEPHIENFSFDCQKNLALPKLPDQANSFFPIVGHSFMSPDRVFGVIEKQLRKKSVIVNPVEYDQIIENYATIRKIQAWNIFDWRTEATRVLKRPAAWHFQFNKMKRFIFNKSSKDNVLLSGEPHYFTDFGMAKGVSENVNNELVGAEEPEATLITNWLELRSQKLRQTMRNHAPTQ
ncbi:hypothetical protein QE152_g12534 [Popillia japonica]|uniref:Uncharacterized protein n=1 Tax=Popillia japonica TaxID=7064 RepID=A0AAW1LRE1_POPJA